jgi:hypothetical protein
MLIRELNYERKKKITLYSVLIPQRDRHSTEGRDGDMGATEILFRKSSAE